MVYTVSCFNYGKFDPAGRTTFATEAEAEKHAAWLRDCGWWFVCIVAHEGEG